MHMISASVTTSGTGVGSDINTVFFMHSCLACDRQILEYLIKDALHKETLSNKLQNKMHYKTPVLIM